MVKSEPENLALGMGIIAFPQAAARAGGVGDVLTVTGLILPK